MKCWSILQLPLVFMTAATRAQQYRLTTTLSHFCSSPGHCKEFSKSFAQGERAIAMGSILNPALYHNPGSTVREWEAGKERTRRVYAFVCLFVCFSWSQTVMLQGGSRHLGEICREKKMQGARTSCPPSGTASLRRQARPPFPAQLEFIFLKSLPHFPCRNYQIFCF